MRDPKDPGTLDLVSGGLRIGYARVSTVDQNLDLQRDALTRAGCSEIYADKASSRATKGRPELANVRRALRPGDTLIVWRLDRLAGNANDLVTIVNDLIERGIEFESLNEKIDTRSPVGRMFLTIMASLAQYRLDVIQENTLAGLKAARARGRVGGRPAALDETAIGEIRALLADPTITMSQVAERYQVSRATLYNTLSRAAKAAKKKTEAKT